MQYKLGGQTYVAGSTNTIVESHEDYTPISATKPGRFRLMASHDFGPGQP